MPKLEDFAVLDGATSEGISTSDPQFGYATAFDAATGRYEGLVYGRLAPPSVAPQGLLVRKDVAEAQVRDTT